MLTNGAQIFKRKSILQSSIVSVGIHAVCAILQEKLRNIEKRNSGAAQAVVVIISKNIIVIFFIGHNCTSATQVRRGRHTRIE